MTQHPTNDPTRDDGGSDGSDGGETDPDMAAWPRFGVDGLTATPPPPPLVTELPSWAAWCDQLDASLIRHGIRTPQMARTTPPELRKRVGNVAGRYAQPPREGPPQPVPTTPAWLIDLPDRDDDAPQPFRQPRAASETMCYACLARPIDAAHTRRMEHPRMAYLCRDCRDLARDVCQLETARNPRIALYTVLDAFFRYIWQSVPDQDERPDADRVSQEPGKRLQRGKR